MSDSMQGEAESFAGFAMLVHFETIQSAGEAFEKLASTGRALLDFGPTPWASGYGIVLDEFGIKWKIQASQ